MAKRKAPPVTRRKQTSQRGGTGRSRTRSAGLARKKSVYAATDVIVTLTGQLDGAGPFGGTGFEGGSFCGTFTIDPLAVDKYDSSMQLGDAFGIYALKAWNIDLFNSANVLLGHAENSHGGTAEIWITQDPTASGQFGNIGLEFIESANLFFSTSSYPGLSVGLGVWFNSPSITTDDLPTAFLDATYSGDGAFAFFPNEATAVTFTASAAISTPFGVPGPTTLVLCADKQEMSINLGTVKTRLDRAYQKFRFSGRNALLQLLRTKRN